MNACNAQSDKYHWLIGTWKIDSKNIYETWSKGDDGTTVHGISYILNGADTTVTETITLKFFDDAYHYIPDIAGDQPPVDFKITSDEAGRFIAENARHDFPKIIRYKYVEDDQKRIEATIEGDGKVISYSFRKVK